MTDSKVTDGATLKCTLGTATSELRVPVFHGALLRDKNQADISDSVGNVNIKPFDMCKRQAPPVPCTPSTCMKWVLARNDHAIREELILLDCCIVPCVFGGIIKIIDSGQ
jgi:hypothetical protein